MFRIAVTASDGRPAAVTVQVDDHPAECRPYVLRDIADRLRIKRNDIIHVLETWTAEQLRAHLESFTSEDLKPPSLRR